MMKDSIHEKDNMVLKLFKQMHDNRIINMRFSYIIGALILLIPPLIDALKPLDVLPIEQGLSKFLKDVSMLVGFLPIMFSFIKDATDQMSDFASANFKDTIGPETNRAVEHGLKNTKLNDVIITGKTLEVFERTRRTNSMFPVKRAIDFIWRKQEQGKIPPLDDIHYHIRIGEYFLGSDSSCPIKKDNIKSWRWFRIDYISYHGFDLGIDGPSPTSSEDTFFIRTDQKPGELLSRMIRPVVVLRYRDYVNHADLWDECRFIVVYPITERTITDVRGKEGDGYVDGTIGRDDRGCRSSK